MQHISISRLKGTLKATRHGGILLIKHLLGLKYLRNFEAAKNFDSEEFTRYQITKLKATIYNAVNTVPYYGSKRDEYMRGIEYLPLEKLPVLSKEVVRKNTHQFYAIKDVGKTMSHTTSGTSGSYLMIKTSIKTHAMFQAGIERFHRMFDVNPLAPTVCLTGFFRPATQDDPLLYWNDYMGNRIFLNIYQFKAEFGEAFGKLLNRFNPFSIFGYASSVYLLSQILKDSQSRKGNRLKAVFTTSEILYPEWREKIQKVFNVPVADQYGSQEGQCLATECPYGLMHINPEHGIVEVLDGNLQPVNDGIEGEICLTGLINDAMPLIRYSIGDRGVVRHLSKRCSCGLSWPIIEHLSGRAEDAIIAPDGRPIMYLNFHITKNICGIIESQFIQDDPKHITVLLVIDNSFKKENEEMIKSEIKKRTQVDFGIDIQYVLEIARGPRGKFKAVVNKLRDIQRS